MQVPKTESALYNLVFVPVAAVRTHSSLLGGKWKFSWPWTGPKFLLEFSGRFGQCNVAFRYSILFLFRGPWHLQWEALHGAKWRRYFSPAPLVFWHFSRLSFIPFFVFDRHDVAH